MRFLIGGRMLNSTEKICICHNKDKLETKLITPLHVFNDFLENNLCLNFNLEEAAQPQYVMIPYVGYGNIQVGKKWMDLSNFQGLILRLMLYNLFIAGCKTGWSAIPYSEGIKLREAGRDFMKFNKAECNILQKLGTYWLVSSFKKRFWDVPVAKWNLFQECVLEDMKHISSMWKSVANRPESFFSIWH